MDFDAWRVQARPPAVRRRVFINALAASVANNRTHAYKHNFSDKELGSQRIRFKDLVVTHARNRSLGCVVIYPARL